MAIIDFFDRGWDMDGKAAAYIQGDRAFTFDEVGELSCRIANTLLALGLPKETKGAVWSGNDVMAWACTLGLWRANMAWIPVNPRNAADNNGFILDAFDCEVLFFQQAYSEIITALRPALPKVKHWICIDADLPDTPGLEAWCGSQPATKPAVVAGLDDVFIIMPTGGTTGAPKGVMNTHRAAQTTFVHFMLTCTYRDGTRPVNLAAAPMTHTAGLLSLPCTAQGGTVVVLPRPDPMLLVQAIGKHRVTEFFLPPTVIYALLEAPGIEKVDFSNHQRHDMGFARLHALAGYGPDGIVQVEFGPDRKARFVGSDSVVDREAQSIAPDGRRGVCHLPHEGRDVYVGHGLHVAALVVLARQPFTHGSQRDFLWHPAFDVGEVQHHADALQHAPGRFGNLQPNRGESFDHAGAIHLIDLLPSDPGKDMPFKAGQPTRVMALLPAVTQRFMATAGRSFECRDDLPRLAALGDRVEAVAHLPA